MYWSLMRILGRRRVGRRTGGGIARERRCVRWRSNGVAASRVVVRCAKGRSVVLWFVVWSVAQILRQGSQPIKTPRLHFPLLGRLLPPTPSVVEVSNIYRALCPGFTHFQLFSKPSPTPRPQESLVRRPIESWLNASISNRFYPRSI